MEVFNIDLISEQSIDIGLNLIGYLAAGMFWMLIHTAWTNRNKKEAAVNTTAANLNITNQPLNIQKPEPRKPAQNVQFLNLASPVEPVSQSQREKIPTVIEPSSNRRDRQDIVRIARQMIKNGVNDNQVKATLPISDGELALIKQSNNI